MDGQLKTGRRGSKENQGIRGEGSGLGIKLEDVEQRRAGAVPRPSHDHEELLL